MSTEAYLGAIRIEPINNHLFNFFMENITEEKRARILKFKRKEDQLRTLFADILARLMICKHYQCRNNRLHFEFNAYGKPYLPNMNGLHFSVSHSGAWVVVALSTVPVGIDVEEIKTIDYKVISDRYFSDRETSDLLKKGGNQQLNYFYDLWTLKESFVKNLGVGLSKPLDSFSITRDQSAFNLLQSNGQISSEYQFLQWPIDNAHVCSICLRGENQKLRLEKSFFTMEELTREFIQFT